MNYVLLDTNIIIDMVVDRRNQIDNKLLNKFLKLLEFDEIKLIVPEIVKTETYRHLDKEIMLEYKSKKYWMILENFMVCQRLR